ncbi:glycosyltransferase family 2 protein [Chryseobacterium gotjawalense]|uniref:Glycosyltransferase family 2 protein n=1 Tax=Chryseobacterium gotjawalense TaxID=3042315 RepID=A0ABY8RE26_9FLAO|nr:glycosyltransferase family 2 protein [Chryseobacterium sp. wdc7]WHF51423.1 glycosyltransferase family 2 protein [Chryseobacterium sp. wdc7]
MSNLLAIIIPYYKITFLRETLDSLAAQTDQRFTVYIGNDASPENPEDLLEEFEGKFNFVYKNFEENLGGTSLTKQWNRCIEMMQDEEWFMILGDDDYFSSNVIEEFYKNIVFAERENVNVMKLNSATVNENSVITSEKKPEPFIKSSIDHFFDKFIFEGRSSLSEHIFKKSQYDLYCFKNLPLAWHADDLAVLEFSEYANTMFLEKAKCFVRISAESISGNPEKFKKEKWGATKMFFDSVCYNLSKFNKAQKAQLFDLIEWHEKEKNIKVKIPNRLTEFFSVYGYKALLKFLR